MKSGGFACGRILQLRGAEMPTKTRAFFGGLHNWRGSALPTQTDIADAGFVAYGVMHVKSITYRGGAVLGERPLHLDNHELPALLSAHGGPGTMVLQGAEPVREALVSEWGTLPVLEFWGYDFIAELAEARLNAKAA